MEYLSATNPFDNIVLMINPYIITCKHLFMMVDNSLNNN